MHSSLSLITIPWLFSISSRIPGVYPNPDCLRARMLVLNFSDEARALITAPVPWHTPFLIRNIKHEMVVVMPVFNIVVVGDIIRESEKVAEFHPEFSIVPVFSIGDSISKNIYPLLWKRFVRVSISSCQIWVVSEIPLLVPWVSYLDDSF